MSKKFFCIPMITNENELQDGGRYKILKKVIGNFFLRFKWRKEIKSFVRSSLGEVEIEKLENSPIVVNEDYLDEGFVIDFDPREVK